ncbi:hypothetical protein BpHYR1_011222 [Brachionus plicatilis]|uniref:Uncharacterized protein n=1 Tax=Brachionus plicatilis TaxID=10195 RepID=A0A3M7SNH5_BRAPC|nr:hypothetical protein BpHYR1_011222 [Brachionus plicatilis]
MKRNRYLEKLAKFILLGVDLNLLEILINKHFLKLLDYFVSILIRVAIGLLIKIWIDEISEACKLAYLIHLCDDFLIRNQKTVDGLIEIRCLISRLIFFSINSFICIFLRMLSVKILNNIHMIIEKPYQNILNLKKIEIIFAPHAWQLSDKRSLGYIDYYSFVLDKDFQFSSHVRILVYIIPRDIGKNKHQRNDKTKIDKKLLYSLINISALSTILIFCEKRDMKMSHKYLLPYFYQDLNINH